MVTSLYGPNIFILVPRAVILVAGKALSNRLIC